MVYVLVFMFCACFMRHAQCQQVLDKPQTNFSRIDSLGLTPPRTLQLKDAIAAHNYVAAEIILLHSIRHSQNSAQQSNLLAFIGGIYYLNHDYLNAAIAWKKSEALTPLPPTLKFSLAMAYIQMGHPSWARQPLNDLAAQYPTNALYPYWIGRLDYDAHLYNRAIQHFQIATGLAPRMADAYDNLGLCYFYLNQNSKAIANFHKSIQLNHELGHPSAWPYLNLAITLEFMNRMTAAETNLQEAIRLDPRIASAHYQMGNILEQQGKLKSAIHEYTTAAHLDKYYAKPHFALARIYQRLGSKALAQEEVQQYLRIHNHSNAAHKSSPTSH